MKQWTIVVTFFLLLGIFFSASTILPSAVKGFTLYVGGGGPGNYTVIQEAIDDANSGDIIHVLGGTYTENVVVNKTLSLVGEGSEVTVVDGNASGDVIRVIANHVTITGFTITNGGPNSKDAGLEIESARGCHIANNNVSSNDQLGIYVQDSSEFNDIMNNVANDNKFGIRLESSRWNTIIQNDVSTNSAYGIYLDSASYNVIAGNNASYSGNEGIVLIESEKNIISNNEIAETVIGIDSISSYNNTIANNDILNNQNGIFLDFSENNGIYHNNIVNNTEQAVGLLHLNEWDDGYPSGGNYWSDYNGEDIKSGPYQDEPGGDGIGDVLHLIRGLGIDHYPKMSMYDQTPTTPSEPRDVQAVADYQQVDLEWSPSAFGGNSPIVLYLVYRGLSPGEETLHHEIDVFQPYGSFHLGDGDLKNGQTYYYRISAKNALGIEGPKSDEIDATPSDELPTCTIVSPVQGETVSGNYTISGTASDREGTLETVEVRIDDGPWAGADGTESWSFTWNTETVPDGDHTIHARSYDGMNYSDVTQVAVSVGNERPQESVFYQSWFWIAIAVVVIVVLALFFTMARRRKRGD
ncbi:MAG: NosD domain-containing protein [Thermoplasmata archaeon]